ncbi:efflux RND transporter periplasmic adaptor subunit [Shewanella gaetbuli]|uniref:Efflux RND transporter periplasmic adaptor subunit n=1 Tax=Shewanella gaetbuli TaxID=220752 RepID=A0A9X1ZPT7_9GAMM|nr:efflux RND transporter periplasmic adaptor subunit [Shewanella gaetbuli]MCL1141853.1 efflux RND transporter periplasmic adaptor subunit [Shewanella gaetbuli]
MKKIILIIILFIGMFAGYVVSKDKADKPQPNNRPTRVIPVITATVDVHPLSQSVTLIGKLKAKHSVLLAPQISGKIKHINVTSNQYVEKGQLLISLEDAKAKANVTEAQAYYVDELRIQDEFSRLINVNAITQTEIEAQKAKVDIASARLAAATADLNYHSLVAPFSGNVGLINFSRGKMANAAETLLSLDDLSHLYLDLNIPEHYLSQLSHGMAISATSKAWANTQFAGTVVAIDPRVNEDTLNLTVRAEFENTNNQLKPGMMMSATVVFPSISAPIVPVQALEYSGTKRFVYVIDKNNIAHKTEVELGARVNDEVLINSGLNIGDTIVVQGLVNMRNGIKVNNLTHVAQNMPTDAATVEAR